MGPTCRSATGLSAPISDVIASRQLNYHLYADDTQLYLAFKTDGVNLAIDRVVSCVRDRLLDGTE